MRQQDRLPETPGVGRKALRTCSLPELLSSPDLQTKVGAGSGSGGEGGGHSVMPVGRPKRQLHVGLWGSGAARAGRC